MLKRLVVCLACFLGLATAAAAAAEDWRAASDGTFYDNDFIRKDETSGLILVRYASGGRAGAPYAAWPKSKSPIALYALDCDNDKYLDLGLDFDGTHGLPKGWRNTEREENIKAGVGPSGTAACAMKDTAPKVTLP